VGVVNGSDVDVCVFFFASVSDTLGGILIDHCSCDGVFGWDSGDSWGWPGHRAGW
jgi:hypothetical protein